MLERPPVASFVGRRGAVVLLGAALAAVAWIALDLSVAGLLPRGGRMGGAEIARELFGAAFTPALDYEGAVPAGARPFLLRVADATLLTVVFAVASMSLALVGGFVLGVLSSSAWWSAEVAGGRCGLACRVAPALQIGARVTAAALRSVHELLWAVVFLAAFGIQTGAAVIALALPFAGTLAKVFSELFDEAPRGATRALQAAGATPLQAFGVGALPRALPDVGAYAFYRLECAVRSAAILGFFGFETLGYEIKLAFDNLDYHEVWTYLYALIVLVLLLETWSASLRRRFVA